MPSPAAQMLLSRLRKLARNAEAGSEDAELLDRFVHGQDRSAFAALVERHGTMVLAVGRRVLGEWHAAEDVFQATFLVLARKASSIRRGTALSGWLYGVAHRLAMRARVDATRRSARESRVLARRVTDASAGVMRQEMLAILDDELARLPEKLRLPLVLCYLEGKPRDEAALRVGWSLRTLHRRLERGRAVLRARLTRRGLELTAMIAATGLMRDAAASNLTHALVQATVQAALGFGAGQGTLPVAVNALAEAGIRTLALARWKAIALGLAAATALAGGVSLVIGWTIASSPVPEPPMLLAQEPPRPPARPGPANPDGRRTRAAALLRKALDELKHADGKLLNRAVADIAVLQMRLGERVEAEKSFARARQLILGQPSENTDEWRHLAIDLARAGDIQGAQAVSEGIPVPAPQAEGKGNNERDFVFEECACVLAKIGNIKGALQFAGRIMDKKRHAWIPAMLWVDLVLYQARKGDYTSAIQTVDSIPEAGDKILALAGVVYGNHTFADYPHEPGVALIQAKADNQGETRRTLKQAASLLADVKNPLKQGRARAALACAQAALGDLAEAVLTAKTIQDKTWISIAQAAIAQVQAAAGHESEALRTVESLSDKDAQVHGLYHMVIGQIQAGDRRGARATLQRALDLAKTLPERKRGTEFYNLLIVQGRAGDGRGAREIAKTLLPDSSVAISNIAGEQAKAGDLQGAGETAQSLPPGDWQTAGAMRYIARILTIAGIEKEAVSWAESLATPYARGNALLGAAEGLLGLGPRD
jgi:RNA polymerase sigma factor (sigma-70 family)